MKPDEYQIQGTYKPAPKPEPISLGELAKGPIKFSWKLLAGIAGGVVATTIILAHTMTPATIPDKNPVFSDSSPSDVILETVTELDTRYYPPRPRWEILKHFDSTNACLSYARSAGYHGGETLGAVKCVYF